MIGQKSFLALVFRYMERKNKSLGFEVGDLANYRSSVNKYIGKTRQRSEREIAARKRGEKTPQCARAGVQGDGFRGTDENKLSS